MKLSNDINDVVDSTAHIENLLDQIITNFTCPRNDAYLFFWQIMLDSSILSLGAKIKVVMAISQECDCKIDQNSLHSVISYRNAFAHQRTDSNPTEVNGASLDEREHHYMLHIIKNSGKTEMKKRSEALDEFNKAFIQAKASLRPLLEHTTSIAKEAAAKVAG
ncbi:MAG: hypothetical protein OEV12_12080 [Gammaproteobacteria bacterium]|nr:hypothetical protein [Gammaproteobacteria bacterium]MDH3889046.1 hypothetical protein [Gammaproteobacteria bacterium]MDH3987133.1 hypothetical protein [Gammaproteobacteria bacterium]